MKPTALLAAPLLALLASGCGAIGTYRALQAYEPVYTNVTPTDTTTTDVTSRRAADGREATLLSAFYGIDGGLPKPTNPWMQDSCLVV